MRNKPSRCASTVGVFIFAVRFIFCGFASLSAHGHNRIYFFFLLQIKLWFSNEGEKQLAPLDSLTLSVDKIKEMRESLEQFLEESVVNSSSVFFFSPPHTSLRRHRHSKLIIFFFRQIQQRHGLQLVKESPASLPGSVLLDFKQHLGTILSRVGRRKDQLDILINLYEFYDSVSVKSVV